MLYNMFAPDGEVITIEPVGTIQFGCEAAFARGADGGKGCALITIEVIDEVQPDVIFCAVTV